MYLMRATILCSQEREEVSGPGQVDPVADDRQVHPLAIRDAQEGIPAVACFHHSQPGAFFWSNDTGLIAIFKLFMDFILVVLLILQ